MKKNIGTLLIALAFSGLVHAQENDCRMALYDVHELISEESKKVLFGKGYIRLDEITNVGEDLDGKPYPFRLEAKPGNAYALPDISKENKYNVYSGSVSASLMKYWRKGRHVRAGLYEAHYEIPVSLCDTNDSLCEKNKPAQIKAMDIAIKQVKTCDEAYGNKHD